MPSTALTAPPACRYEKTPAGIIRRGLLVRRSAERVDHFIDAEDAQIPFLGGGATRATAAERTLDGPLAQTHEAADDDGPISRLDVPGTHLDVVHGVAAVEVNIAVEAGDDGGDGSVHGGFPFGSGFGWTLIEDHARQIRWNHAVVED
nr:MAG TPA: hypothetical protein [Caudoviricetes sp.]